MNQLTSVHILCCNTSIFRLHLRTRSFHCKWSWEDTTPAIQMNMTGLTCADGGIVRYDLQPGEVWKDGSKALVMDAQTSLSENSADSWWTCWCTGTMRLDRWLLEHSILHQGMHVHCRWGRLTTDTWWPGKTTWTTQLPRLPVAFLAVCYLERVSAVPLLALVCLIMRDNAICSWHEVTCNLNRALLQLSSHTCRGLM